MSKKINPNYGQAVLKPIDESESTFGNIVLPDLGNTKAGKAIIIDIAPIYNFNLGTFVESKFKIGDTVLFPLMGCQKITLDREDFLICSVSDLPASIVEQEEK